MNRRDFTKTASLLAVSAMLPVHSLSAKSYLSPEQAKQILWGDTPLAKFDVRLSAAQMQSIASASGTRVRSANLQAWKTADGGWFLIDQVIGKHENIDLAVALMPDGKVKGIEVLAYRESYGDEVMNAKWRDQFRGKDHSATLRLDREIQNISGATLSCRHITDGINRLTHTWDQVLRKM